MKENDELKLVASAAGSETVSPTIAAKLKDENTEALAQLSRLKSATVALKTETEEAEDKLAIIRGQHDTLQTALARLRASEKILSQAGALEVGCHDSNEVSLPQDMQDTFVQANNADAVSCPHKFHGLSNGLLDCWCLSIANAMPLLLCRVAIKRPH